MYTKSSLPNGVRVVSIPMPAVKTATALVMVEAGSRYETPQINGLSHFLEHMIFKGTKKRPNSLAISSLIDGIGGTFNAFTGKEYTGFYVKAESEHLPLILDVLSDMLLNSLYNREELDRERGVIIEEINMYEDQPQARVGEYFEELLYDGHPLSRQIVGTKKVIEKVTREDMVDYVNRMYHSGAIVIGLAGNLANPDVEKYFKGVPKGSENTFEKVKENQTKPASLVHYKKTDQSHMSVGVRAYDMNHPDRYVLEVLGTILGGNMSSRRFIEVREKRGLAYYVHSDNEEFHDAGFFVTQAGIRLSNVQEALKVILGEYGKVRDIRVTPEELRRAKDYAKGRMALSLEDSFRVASFYAAQELLRKEIETPDDVLARIEKVTAEDVQRVAKDIFVNQKLNLAIIGPFKNPDQFSSLLKI